MNKKQLSDMLIKDYQFFNDFTNFTPGSPGFGLTSDHNLDPNRASIASTGYMLCSLVIGCEHQQLSRDEGLYKSKHTLKTILNLPHHDGFYPHFLDRESGEIYGKSEYSTIDSMLLFMGVLAVDAYFNDAEIEAMTRALFSRIQWKNWLTTYQDKQVFYMAYNPHPKGDYITEAPGYIYHWHMYAEQLMMYFLYPYEDGYELYKNMEKIKGHYQEHHYLYSPGNTLFIYQFPHVFINFKDYVDDEQISWFENSRNAIYGHQQLSMDLNPSYQTFSKFFFGFNASDSPQGYRVFHAIPNVDNKVITDGTVAPFGLVGTLPFDERLGLNSIESMLKIKELDSPYGFYDAFNLEHDIWISKKYIGIDKGHEMLSLDLYLNQTIQNLITNHPRIQQGYKRLKFIKLEGNHGND